MYEFRDGSCGRAFSLLLFVYWCWNAAIAHTKCKLHEYTIFAFLPVVITLLIANV